MGVDDSNEEYVPAVGGWPVDPQDDVPISKSRIWIDGCFDFAHHGMVSSLLRNVASHIEP